jgi:hypothetical protein
MVKTHNTSSDTSTLLTPPTPKLDDPLLVFSLHSVAPPDLGANFKQSLPTIIYEDNTAAIEMINSGKPTNGTRHVDIQLFAIQEWKDRGDIILQHIPGIVNIADALTKALGWILHNRHICRAMGHFFPPWKKSPSWTQSKPTTST